MFLSRFPVDTQTVIWNCSMWIGLTRYVQTQNTSGTIQHARLQGTESQDWWYYNNRPQILDAATSISGSKPRFQEVLDTMEKDQNDRVKKQEIYSLQSILTWSITLLPSAFAFCVSLAMVQKLIHKCLCREARPAAWQLQHASAMIEKKMQWVINSEAVFHIWPNLAQRQEEYFKNRCRNRTHQSEG